MHVFIAFYSDFIAFSLVVCLQIMSSALSIMSSGLASTNAALHSPTPHPPTGHRVGPGGSTKAAGAS